MLQVTWVSSDDDDDDDNGADDDDDEKVLQVTWVSGLPTIKSELVVTRNLGPAAPEFGLKGPLRASLQQVQPVWFPPFSSLGSEESRET